MRSGRLHIAGVATGPTAFAVNLAGFVPLVAMQRPDGSVGYTLQLITHRDSPIKSLNDLKGKRVAHVAPSSNSKSTSSKTDGGRSILASVMLNARTPSKMRWRRKAKPVIRQR